MSWLADAHADWHTVHGWDSCPLDCYAVEARHQEEYERQMEEDAARAATTVGTVIHGTLRTEELAPAFLRVLETVAPWIIGTDWHREMQQDVDLVTVHGDNVPNAYDIVVRIEDEINTHLPHGYRFGSHEGDGADFGIWEVEVEREDA